MAAAVVLKHGAAAASLLVPLGASPQGAPASAPRAVVRVRHEAAVAAETARRAADKSGRTARVSAKRVRVAVEEAKSVVPQAQRKASAARPVRVARRRWDHNVHAHPKKGKFKRFYRMKATAYTPINTRMEGGRWTYTERDGRSAHGVAVDPDLIPLGSHLWIPGYGHAIADDIGGRIKGHRVDLRMQNAREMRDWGVRKVRVYVLAHAPGEE